MKDAHREEISAIQLAKRELEQDLSQLEQLLKASAENTLLIGSENHRVYAHRDGRIGLIVLQTITGLIDTKRQQIKTAAEQLAKTI